ncbi:nuclear mRNA export, poly(A)+RNA binding protein [Allomyces javanicus]|nr:nuclear mRNA export, poly(A)+RNA binding protein [Allomyces javanicus]
MNINDRLGPRLGGGPRGNGQAHSSPPAAQSNIFARLGTAPGTPATSPDVNDAPSRGGGGCSNSGRGRGRGGGYNGRRTRDNAERDYDQGRSYPPGVAADFAGSSGAAAPASLPPGAVEMTISGLDRVPDVNRALNTLRNSAPLRIDILSGEFRGTTYHVVVRNHSQASSLQKLNNKWVEGQKLFITRAPSTSATTAAPSGNDSPNASRTAQVLLSFLESRWHAPTQTLNLSRLLEDPILGQHRINPLREPLMRQALAGLLKKHNIEPLRISLAGNRIGPMQHWADFLRMFPTLVALDLSDNSTETFGGLEPLNATTHPCLVELDLRGTPVHRRSADDPDKYRRHMTHRFPKLTTLDGATLVGVQLALDTSTNLPIRGSFITPDVHATVAHFLTAFLGAMDARRDDLVHVYHAEALFSVAVTGVTTYVSGLWREKTRNLREIRAAHQRNLRLCHGPAEIMTALRNLPQTRHVAESLVVDAWPVPGGLPGTGAPALLVFVHGDVKELDASRPNAEFPRSFDRSLMLIPTPAGSEAANMRIPYQIVQDQWIMRAASPRAPWLDPAVGATNPLLASPTAAAPAATPVPPPPAPSPIPAAAVAGLPPKPPGMSDPDYQLVLQTMQQCALTFDGAIACLQQANGDVNAILVARTNGQIPLEWCQS